MKMTVEYSTHPSVACNTLNSNDVVDSKPAKLINKAILAKLPPCCQVTTIAGTNGSSCKKMAKSDQRMGGSSFRHMLPIALCLFSFAVVFTVLLLYMDTDQIRHQQFRLNMSRDYELNNVAQDNPELVEFLREFHMKKHPMHFLKKEPYAEHLNFTERHEQTPVMAQYISNLVGSKLNGAYIQTMTGSTSNLLTGPWLTETLSWSGTVMEPDPRRYFSLRKQNVHRPKVQIVHACVSPNEHPKEVTIHNEDDVRINSLLDEETLWFSRVKCFPLYTLMLAVNRVQYDLLSLGVHGQELDILKTLPFDKVKIEVISIHLTENIENIREYSLAISKFLGEKSYRLQKTIGFNYIYQKVNASRQKKKTA